MSDILCEINQLVVRLEEKGPGPVENGRVVAAIKRLQDVLNRYVDKEDS